MPDRRLVLTPKLGLTGPHGFAPLAHGVQYGPSGVTGLLAGPDDELVRCQGFDLVLDLAFGPDGSGGSYSGADAEPEEALHQPVIPSYAHAGALIGGKILHACDVSIPTM